MKRHFHTYLAAVQWLFPVFAASVFAASLSALTTAKAEETAAGLPPLEERGYVLGDVFLGDENAPVTIIEYLSFTCSHCATYHADSFPQVKANYIDAGKVRYIFREVYFDAVGLLAARIARCTGPQGYFTLADEILNSQYEWMRAEDIPLELVRTVLRAGVPATRLKSCLEDREFALVLVDAYKDHIARDAINSTPTFLIGGTRVEGAQPYARIATVIEEALAN